MKGIFVNEDGGIHYATAIVSGLKTIETRSRNMLASLVGKRVAIVRTRRGQNPVVVGYADIVWAERNGEPWMHNHRHMTLIPEGSKYDTGSRWCYFLGRAERCEPYPLPANAVRHGRSWCEW